jgi:predicted Holliday junction resolvase-like endonuclease
MTELEMVLIILMMVAFTLVLYVILLRNNIKTYKKELELKKHYIDPTDSPSVIKLKCIDKQLEDIGKRL